MDARSLATLILVLCCASGLVRAAEPGFANGCAGLAKAQALSLGHEARRQGEFRRAAACYLAADEPLQADRAMAQHFARTSATSGRKMGETLASARQQAREIRDSLRRR